MASTKEQQQKEIKEALEAIATLKDTMQDNKRGLRALYYNRQMKLMLARATLISILLLAFLIANKFLWSISDDITVYITIGTFLFLVIGEGIVKDIVHRKILQETTGLKSLSELFTQKGFDIVGKNMSIVFFATLAVGCGICIQVGNWWYMLPILLLASAFINLYASTAFHMRESQIVGYIQLFVAVILAIFAQSHYEFWLAGSCALIYASCLLVIKWDD